MAGPTDDDFREYLDAARTGDARIVGVFLEKFPGNADARPWFRDTTGLKEAATGGHKHLIELFLKAGADIDRSDSSGSTTPLMHAATAGHTDCVTLLIDRGADLERMNTTGETALTSMAQLGRIDMARLLIGRGADVNAGATRGFTPLRAAAYHDKPEMVRLLLARGAASGVDLRDGLYMTPLMWAAQRGSTEMVTLLLECGASKHLKNLNGQTAADVARAEGHDEVAKLIRQGLPRRAIAEIPEAQARDIALQALKKRATLRLPKAPRP